MVLWIRWHLIIALEVQCTLTTNHKIQFSISIFFLEMIRMATLACLLLMCIEISQWSLDTDIELLFRNSGRFIKHSSTEIAGCYRLDTVNSKYK